MERKWNASYPLIAKSWRANRQRVIPFFAYPSEIRKVIYTTNAIESLNMSLRKAIKAKGAFPHDEAVFKIFWLVLRSISKKWTSPSGAGKWLYVTKKTVQSITNNYGLDKKTIF